MMRIQLRVNLLWLHCIKDCWRLVTACLWSGCFNISSIGSLDALRNIILLISKYAIIEFSPFPIETGKCLFQQVHIVLLQVFVNEHTWNANENRPSRRFVRLEDNRPKPGVELLLGDVVFNQLETIIPERTGVNTHI